MSESIAIVVLMTAASDQEATRIADHLVENRLAACVQLISGMVSVYRWEGNIEHSSEILLLAKSTQDKFDEIEATVRSLHSYETPEIIALPITAVSRPYLEWLKESVSE